jgi:hypothetical protein
MLEPPELHPPVRIVVMYVLLSVSVFDGDLTFIMDIVCLLADDKDVFDMTPVA